MAVEPGALRFGVDGGVEAKMLNGMMAVFARRIYPKGTAIYSFHGPRLAKPTAYSVQFAPDVHIDCDDECRFTNHSCDANASLDYSNDTATLVATRDIAVGEQVTFNYNTTEWSMASPFICLCGSPRCIKLVSGCKSLDTPMRLSLWSLFPSFLKELCVSDGFQPPSSMTTTTVGSV
jgi:hypothetical protein